MLRARVETQELQELLSERLTKVAVGRMNWSTALPVVHKENRKFSQELAGRSVGIRPIQQSVRRCLVLKGGSLGE